VKVYVLTKNKKSLMPTTCSKARILIKKGKARVHKRQPFTIQLLNRVAGEVEHVNLGIDSGANNIGFSAVSGREELISGTVILDVMMKSRLDDRRMYRRNRRNRLWYRKPRFDNRKRADDWLPPSIKRRYQSHLTIINKIKSLLPVKYICIEVGNFDIQAIKKPGISSTGYQQGDRYGYANLKSYIIAREKSHCQLCGKSVIGTKINLHHIISRCKGGTNKADNLALLHVKCHKRIHKKGLGKTLKRNKQYRESTFMNIIKWKFKQDLVCTLTFGFKTFCKRTELNIPKTHNNDAFVIAGGTEQARLLHLEVIQKRKNNRSLQKNRKGFAPAIRRQRYSIQPKDLVRIKSKWLITNGCHCKGTRILVNKRSINIKQVESVFNVGTLGGWQFLPLLKSYN